MSASGVSPDLHITGWETVLIEDFDTDVPMGKVIGSSAYSKTLTAYPTGWRTSKPWRTGMYDNGRLEVTNSCLVSHIATVTDSRGTWPRVTAPRPKVSPTTPYGVDHGRFRVRFRVTHELPGYKIAWLLWPDSGQWPRDGEIDFPEQSLLALSKVGGFVHRQGATQGDDQLHARGASSAADGEWHTAEILWKPGDWRTRRCRFQWDGVTIGEWRSETDRIPSTPMHWVVQTEPYLHTYDPPDPTVSGRIEVDWFAYYRQP
jgi:hypothetical protein